MPNYRLRLSLPGASSNGLLPGTTTLTPNVTGTIPFTIGQAFVQGAVPVGSSLNGLQLNTINTWPDGSTKVSVVSGIASMSSGSPYSLVMTIGTAASGTTLTTTELKAALTDTVTVDAGAYGSASWSGTDWDTPFETWVSGPVMSSWIYRKQIGTDNHLVAWLEVRLWSTGAVEVLPWVENGYLTVTSPGARSATYTFSLGGTTRFSAAIDLLHHQRTPLVSGATLSYWLGADPGVVPKHDSVYLMSTEIVPTYSATVGSSDAIITALPSTYTPLQQGSFTYSTDSMPAPGFAEPIGLLPQHDILGLVSTASTYASVVRNGYSAGRYPIYYRDEATNRPVVPLDRPGVCIPPDRGIYAASGAYSGGTNTPAVTGGNGPVWDTAHCPSVGFMAYLLTGSFFHLETMQFATTINYLGRANLAVQRGTAGEGYLIVDPGSVGVRDCAWAWRTLSQALTATPDSDTWRAAWLTVAQNNIDHYHSRYVAQANNPLGYIQTGVASYDAGQYGTAAPWQNDFLTSAWGYSAVQGLPLAAGYQAKLEAFFAFTAKSITHRLATSGWHWQNPATYTSSISSSTLPDWGGGTGPWRTAAEAYAATFATPPAWLASTSGNTIGDENLPGSPTAAMRSFLGNLVPAISYAVRLGAAGAVAAYNRLTGADNWPTLVTAQNSYPGWAVAPASGAVPTWLSAANPAVNEWIEITGTSGAGGASVDAFSGMTVVGSEVVIACAGGHGSGLDNRVVSLDLAAAAPSWTTRMAASASTTNDAAYYPDGKPASRHTYHAIHAIGDKVVLGGCRFTYNGALDLNTVDAFDLSTNTWDGVVSGSPGTSGSGYTNLTPSGYYLYAKDGDGNLWSFLHTTGAAAKYTVSTNTWTTPIGSPVSPSVRYPWAWDSMREQFFGLCWADGEGFGTGLQAVRQVGTTQAAISFNASAALTDLINDAPEYASMVYDPDNDRFLFYEGYSTRAGRVYIITPNASTTWDVSILSTTGATVTATFGTKGSNHTGVQNRFQRVVLGSISGVVVLPRGSSNLFFLRTA